MQQKIEYHNHDVRSQPIEKKQVLEILSSRNLFYEKKGKKVVCLNREKDKIEDKQLLKMFLGRSGTLRAPVLCAENWIMAGFCEETYRTLLEL